MTRAESFLAKLCEQSFLTPWSYPNPYKDQGRKTQDADGKELCDLLVVFGDHVIIFSSKDCEYPIGDDPVLNWTRWYRRAIEASADQLYGAERWLRKHPQTIYLDKRCRTPLPAPLPASMKVHRIVVAHGASAACIAEHGGTGALMLDSRVVGRAHVAPDAVPFTVGQIDLEKGFVHIFDDTTLGAVLFCRDTISDFVSYLEQKEELLQRSKFYVWAAGEDDLLAYYLRNIDPKSGNHCFPVEPESSGLVLEEGFWRDFVSHEKFQNKQIADGISYSWDRLIEHVWERTQRRRARLPHAEHGQDELVLRFLAEETRVERRFLARSFLEVLKRSAEEPWAVRVIEPRADRRRMYVYLFLQKTPDVPAPYYQSRRELLQAYTAVAKYLFDGQADYIIGITTEGGGPNHVETYDFVVRFGDEWEEGEREQAKGLHEQAGLLGGMTRFYKETSEYPSSPHDINDLHPSEGE